MRKVPGRPLREAPPLGRATPLEKTAATFGGFSNGFRGTRRGRVKVYPLPRPKSDRSGPSPK